MVFARTGYMDKSSECIKLALYNIEHSFSEFYKPQLGMYRMNATVKENSIYFNALFRYAQVTAMLGCPTVSSAVGILLLSLDPLGDPMHILLVLDFYLLASNNHSTIRTMLTADSLLLGWPIGHTSIPSEKPPNMTTLKDLPNWAFSEVKATTFFLTDDSIIGIFHFPARRLC